MKSFDILVCNLVCSFKFSNLYCHFSFLFSPSQKNTKSAGARGRGRGRGSVRGRGRGAAARVFTPGSYPMQVCL
jgi:hypothetical protein